MSKVVILTERNNLSKYSKQKKSLFESRLQMTSSRKRNFFPLSIANTQTGTTKNSSSIKYLVRNSKEKDKYKLYNQSKKISNINSYNNSNNNIFNTKKSKKIYNSTFNNFAKNIKQYIINKNSNLNKTNNKIYNSNKTFLNKSLNNSMVGKSMVHSKYLGDISKIKNLKKMEDIKIRKKILSLSNSVSKSTKNNTKYKQNKKKKKDFENNKSIFNLKHSNNNLQIQSYINYSKTIIASNYPKLPLKECKNKNNNIKHNKKSINNKSISKLIYNSHTSFNSYNNLKLGKTEENTKDSNRYLNNGNKIKLKKEKLNLKNAKDKLYKYNKYNINKINNQKIYRNNYHISCKRIHKTTINSLNKKNKKNNQISKVIRTKNNKTIKNINNIDLIQINLHKNRETINSNHALEEIKVNKIENAHCLSENSKINININSETENDKNEEDEEEEEDSNILSIDDVQDIIKYYNFNNINKNDNYLFYFNDYKKFSKMKKSLLNAEFFKETIHSSNSIITGKKEIKISNKKKINNKNLTIYYRNFGTFSPVHIINSDNKNYLKK